MWSQPKSSHVTVSVCMCACVLIVRFVEVLAGLGEYGLTNRVVDPRKFCLRFAERLDSAPEPDLQDDPAGPGRVYPTARVPGVRAQLGGICRPVCIYQ